MDKELYFEMLEKKEEEIQDLKGEIYLLNEEIEMLDSKMRDLNKELDISQYKTSSLLGKLTRAENNIEYLLYNGKITEKDLL